MDLLKAFNSLPHDLIVKRFKEYGADERTANIIEDYFSDRQQTSESCWRIFELELYFQRDCPRINPQAFDIQYFHQRPPVHREKMQTL